MNHKLYIAFHMADIAIPIASNPDRQSLLDVLGKHHGLTIVETVSPVFAIADMIECASRLMESRTNDSRN